MFLFAVGNSTLIFALLENKQLFTDLKENTDKWTDNYSTSYQQQKDLFVKQLQRHLQKIMKILQYLTNEILNEEIFKGTSTRTTNSQLILDEKTVLKYLKTISLVGIVTSHEGPISIRRFKMSEDIAYWLTSFLYGLIYIHSDEFSVWPMTHVKLFTVRVLSLDT